MSLSPSLLFHYFSKLLLVYLSTCLHYLFFSVFSMLLLRAKYVIEDVNAISSIAKIANQMKTTIYGHSASPSSKKRGHTIGTRTPAAHVYT